MPRKAASGIKGLTKRHTCKKPPADPTRCDCNWTGKYLGYDVVLCVWARCTIDPRTKGKADAVLRRMRQAIDEERFDPAGERPVAAGGKLTLEAFIGTKDQPGEYVERYAMERKLAANSMWSMLGVIATGRLGGFALEQLSESAPEIEEWLNASKAARQWTNKTWNDYHGWLNRLFTQAVAWRRMKHNPMPAILRRVATQPDHFAQRHLQEDAEERLFAACALLNQPRPRSTRGKLTEETAAAILAALTAGKTGVEVAKQFKVSPATVSSIKLGDTWKAGEAAMGTKGTEMERRLVGAFDGGLRAGEMMQVTLSMVNWRKVSFVDADGHKVEGYVITLPPHITKGGKRTGKSQEVFAGTPRFVQLLERRKFQLKDKPPSRQFIFGAEDGSYQASFRKMWQKLFTLAKLDYGRDKGLVWHTTRHEYISRISEQVSGDTTQIMDAARVADVKTAKLYTHTRNERRYAAAAGLGRR